MSYVFFGPFSSNETDKCEYGWKQSGAVPNQDMIDFGDMFGEVHNPMVWTHVGSVPVSTN